MNAKDEIIDWLRDAYAMERGLEVVLMKASGRGTWPNIVRFANERHLEETRRHAEIIEAQLKSLGANTSVVKTSTSVVTNALAGMATMVTHDELLKDLLVSYAAEHFEIACYRALITAAETAGLPKVVEACQQIILNEEQMAAMIGQILPHLVQSYLGEQQTPKAA